MVLLAQSSELPGRGHLGASAEGTYWGRTQGGEGGWLTQTVTRVGWGMTRVGKGAQQGPPGEGCPMLDCPPTEGWARWRGTRGAFHGGSEAEMLPQKLKQAPKDASGQQQRVPNSFPNGNCRKARSTRQGRQGLTGTGSHVPPCSPVTRGVW